MLIYWNTLQICTILFLKILIIIFCFFEEISTYLDPEHLNIMFYDELSIIIIIICFVLLIRMMEMPMKVFFGHHSFYSFNTSFVLVSFLFC